MLIFSNDFLDIYQHLYRLCHPESLEHTEMEQCLRVFPSTSKPLSKQASGGAGLHNPSPWINNLLLSCCCWNKNLFLLIRRVQQICLACLDPSKLPLCVCHISNFSLSFSVFTPDLSSLLKCLATSIWNKACTVWENCWLWPMSTTSYF